jgi:hypothetical protein
MRKTPRTTASGLRLSRETLQDLAPSTDQTLAVRGGATADSTCATVFQFIKSQGTISLDGCLGIPDRRQWVINEIKYVGSQVPDTSVWDHGGLPPISLPGGIITQSEKGGLIPHL